MKKQYKQYFKNSFSLLLFLALTSTLVTSCIKLNKDVALINYTVTFDVDGGSAVEAQTIAINSKATKPSDPTKSGFTFVDWYQDSAKTKIFDFDTPITADTTIYAKYTGTYTVTFDTDGGSAVDSQMVDENAKATEPAPIKYGFRVEGWYQDSTRMMPFDFNTPITANMIIYVKWEATTQDIDMFTISGKDITLNPAANATSQGYSNIEDSRTGGNKNFFDPAEMQKSTDINNPVKDGGHYKSTDATKDGILLEYTFDDAVDIESYEITPRSAWPRRSEGLTIVMYDASGAEIGVRQLGIGAKTVSVANVKKIALAISTTSIQTDPITQFNYITVKLKK